MDKVFLRGIKAYGIHGVLESEKLAAQLFEVDLEVLGDFERAALSDDLDHTVDYSEIGSLVIEAIAECSFNLLESLALEIVNRILKMEHVKEVEATLRKVHPPVDFPVDYVGVTLRRRRV